MLHYLAVILIRSFFKKISISGTPYEGKSSLWAVNHSNGIVDPTVMIAFAPVVLRPLAKAPLWNNPVMRFFLKATKAIPVARPQDIEEMGDKNFDSTWVKKVNTEAFQSINQALLNGDHILIFVEGLGHDDPFLHPFKTGIARMAVQAVSSMSPTVSPRVGVSPRGLTAGPSDLDPAVEPRGPRALAERQGSIKSQGDSETHSSVITIQPALINYSEKNEFKSNLYVEYCEPITVSTADTSVPDIMAKLTASFNDHNINFKTWDEKRNWQYIFVMMYGRQHNSLKEFHDFVEKNRASIEQDPVLFGKIQTMRCMLQSIGISPCDRCWRQTANGQNRFWFLMFVTEILIYTFLIFPLKMLSNIVLGIPLEICNILGNSKKYHRDVYATLKIAHALWVFPVWSCFILGTLTIFMHDSFPDLQPVLMWFILFIGFPAAMFLGHYILEYLKFCSGYFRFGVLKLTFPRGLEEMMGEWAAISKTLITKIKQ